MNSDQMRELAKQYDASQYPDEQRGAKQSDGLLPVHASDHNYVDGR